jgi:xylulokinase
MDYLLGIDLGTTGCKTVLFDVTGRPVASSYAEYPLYTPEDNMVEQDPEDWWKVTCANTKNTLKEANVSSENVVAIGADGHFPGLVMLDKKGKPVRRSIIYSDMRAKKQTELIFNTVGAEEALKITGFPKSFFPGLPVAKILWVRENQPELERITDKVLGVKDFLNFRLTGKAAVDYVEAWWTGLVSVVDYSWSDKMLGNLHMERSWFADIVEPTHVVGEITEEASRDTGLAKNTPVVCGSVDGMCNVIGSGITEPGTAMDVAGTTEIIASLSRKRLPSSIGESIFCWRHLEPDNWVLYTSTATACACLRWFRDQFADVEKEESARSGVPVYQILDSEAALVGAGAGKLIFLPYLAGEYTPFFDLNANGVFLGITVDKERRHFIRAILEGVAYSLRHVIEAFDGLGVAMNTIIAGGGGSKSPLWNQIKADVTGKIVQSLKVPETGCLGSAMLAGIGVGTYSSFREAVRSTISVEQNFSPDRKNHELYSRLFEIYKETYNQLKNTFASLSMS